jgi:putative ABC transport system substrate-binding protein
MHFDQLKRRGFFTLLGGTTLALLRPVGAQQRQGKLPTIGLMGVSASVWRPFTEAFAQRLQELGWIEGRTVNVQHRWGEGRSDRFSEIATEFANMKVDVIVTAGTMVPAVKQATLTIPIVFAVANDPVGEGLVASLVRPGGNVTGLSNQQADAASKRLELLREAKPGLRRVAILANVSYAGSANEIERVHVTARDLGLELLQLKLRAADDIAPAFEALNAQADAIYVVADGLVAANSRRIITFALTARLPMIFPGCQYVEQGGLMAYGANFPALFRRAADLVDKILRGESPADIPVEQPTKFDFIVNMTTARALGLTIPDKLLALADEVIE